MSLAFFMWIVMPAEAATYYVDAMSGLDVNDGLSIDTSWQTLAKVNASSFSPGDVILLKRGAVWRESLVVPSAGAAGNPIRFDAYGSGENPRIDGSSLITGWTVSSGHIYVADVPTGMSVSQLFVDGEYYDIARYPNVGYGIATENAATATTLTDSSLTLTAEQIVGADILLRTVPWRIEKRTVTAYDPATYTASWTGDTNYASRTGYGYYFTNKLWMLDQAHEWYYDSALGKLFLWMDADADPNSHVVELSKQTNGVTIGSGKHYVTLQHLSITKPQSSGISLNNVHDVILDSLDISDAGVNGIYDSGGGVSLTITNNTLSNNVFSGIKINDSTTAASTIANNTITNTGYVGLGKQQNTIAAISTNNADNLIIENNTISNSGYLGISFYGGNNRVRNNVIDRSCLVLDDCGGIYTWGNYPSGNQIVGNIITNSIGNYAGTAYTSTQAEGIYLDDRSSHMTVTGNTTDYTDHGIFIHNSSSDTVTGNTFFGPRRSALWIKEDGLGAGAGTTVNNVITDNIFFNTATPSLSASFVGSLGFVDFGTYDRNSYLSTYNAYPISQTVTSAAMSYTLPTWKAAPAHQDDASVDIGSIYTVSPYAVTGYLGETLFSNGTFDTTISGWTKWSSDGSATATFAPSCGLDGGCLHVTTNIANSIVYNSTFISLVAGHTYEVSFSVLSNGVSSGNAVVLKGASPYTTYSDPFPFVTSTTRQDLSFIFTQPVSVTNDARVDFTTDGANVDYSLDNISIRDVSAFTNTVSDDFSLRTNPTPDAVSVDLGSAKYCGIDNVAVSGSFTLAPFASKILLACFNNNDRVCNNHETFATAPLDCTDDTKKGPFAYLDVASPTSSDVASTEEEQSSPSIRNTPRIVGRGGFIVQSGKDFKKRRHLALYFSRPDGSYYPPVDVKTDARGRFKISYRVTKPAGKYKWYAKDTVSGKKTKVTRYTVQ